MRDPSVFSGELGGELSDRGRWVRWVVPMVLLLLVLILVTFKALARHVQAPSAGADIFLYILTALLCTLVAVFLTLTGCAEQFAKMHHGIRDILTDVTAIRNEQIQLGKTVLDRDQEIRSEASLTAKDHRHLVDTLDRLATDVKAMAPSVAAVKETQAGLRQMVEGSKDELRHGLAAVTERQTTTQEAIHGLQQASASLSDQITTLAGGQEVLQRAVLAESKHLAGRMATVAATQEKLDSRFSSLHQFARAEFGKLAEANQQAAAATDAVVAEQVRLQEAVRVQSEELTGRMATVAATEEQLDSRFSSLHQFARAEFGKLAEANQQAAAAADAVVAEQVRLQETVRVQSEELIGRMASISETLETGLETVRASVGNLNAKMDQGIAEVAAIASQQASVSEALRAHTETLDAQMPTLSAVQGQVDANLQSTQALTQTIADRLTDIANEQAALRRTVEDDRQLLARNVSVAEESYQALQTEVNKITETGQQTAAATAAATTGQTALRETIESAIGELSNRMATLGENQQTLQHSMGNLTETTDRVAQEINSLAGRQESASEALQTQGGALENRISALAVAHGELDARIATLGELTQIIASGVADVTQEQNEMYRTLQESTATLTHNIGTLERNQDTLQHGVSALGEKTREIGAEQAALHETVNVRNKQVADKLVALLESQLSFHAGVSGLSEKTSRILAEVRDVVANQAALNETLQAQNEALDSKTSDLATDHKQLDANIHGLQGLVQTLASDFASVTDRQEVAHRTLQDNARALTDNTLAAVQDLKAIQGEVSQVAETGRQAALALTTMVTEQTAWREAVGTSNETLTDRIAEVAESQRVLHSSLNGLNDKADEIGQEITTVAADQAALCETLRAHAQSAEGKMSALIESHGEAGTNVDRLRERTETIIDGISRIAQEQAVVHTMLQDNGRILTDNLTAVQENQKNLEREFGKVAEIDHVAGAAIEAMATEQSALHSVMKAHNEELTCQISALAENQQSLRVEIDRTTAIGEQTASAIAAVAAEQSAAHEWEKACHKELSDRFSRLSEGQQMVHTGLVNIEGKAAQMNVGIDSLAKEQAILQNLIQDNETTLSDRLSLAIQKQEKMQSGVEELQQISQAASNGIAALVDTEVALSETMRQENEKLCDQLTTLTANHGQLHSNVNHMRELIQKVAGNLTGVAEGQAGAHEALQESTKALTDNTTAIEQHLAALEREVSQLADVSRQGNAAVKAMFREEVALLETIKGQSEELTGQVGILSECQRANLETLNTTTREATGDLRAISVRQEQLEQAIQTSREDLLGRLACVADTHHDWIERFGAAQVEIQTMLSDVASLVKTVTDIQEAYRKGSEELTHILDDQQQHQTDFESQVNQGFTAITDSLSEILKIRDTMRCEIEELRKDAPACTHDISWAVEQLRRHAAATKQSREDGESNPVDLSLGHVSE